MKLSVDDFGTGYSSLTYLKGLPVDEVKIDKGFVDHVTTDAGDRAVVRAVVDIAHTLGLSVVAEGVEREDQLRALRELGVDEAQGYFLARPMPSLEIGQWLRRREISPLPDLPSQFDRSVLSGRRLRAQKQSRGWDRVQHHPVPAPGGLGCEPRSADSTSPTSLPRMSLSPTAIAPHSEQSR